MILDKAAKFLVEKFSTSEVISQKPHGGGGGKHPPPSAFRVKVTDKQNLYFWMLHTYTLRRKFHFPASNYFDIVLCISQFQA